MRSGFRSGWPCSLATLANGSAVSDLSSRQALPGYASTEMDVPDTLQHPHARLGETPNNKTLRLSRWADFGSTTELVLRYGVMCNVHDLVVFLWTFLEQQHLYAGRCHGQNECALQDPLAGTPLGWQLGPQPATSLISIHLP